MGDLAMTALQEGQVWVVRYQKTTILDACRYQVAWLGEVACASQQEAIQVARAYNTLMVGQADGTWAKIGLQRYGGVKRDADCDV